MIRSKFRAIAIAMIIAVAPLPSGCATVPAYATCENAKRAVDAASVAYAYACPVPPPAPH